LTSSLLEKRRNQPQLHSEFLKNSNLDTKMMKFKRLSFAFEHMTDPIDKKITELERELRLKKRSESYLK